MTISGIYISRRRPVNNNKVNGMKLHFYAADKNSYFYVKVAFLLKNMKSLFCTQCMLYS